VLKSIGVPEDLPFTPDPFQTEAIAALEQGDVIVSAPTGSGKTYIAAQAMSRILSRGGKAWYASPLKALSNSKYLEFSAQFGESRVGLLTGDHKVNPEAPVIVGTTEILRNQLYDAMSKGLNFESNLVIMDEAHYLGDPDRGVVWEEVAIYLPPRVRLLLLSATVANATELGEWLAHIRKEKVSAIITHDRPVPLFPTFLFPDGLLIPLGKGRRLSPQIRQFMEQNNFRKQGFNQSQTPIGRILAILNEANLLPAIFFLKSRADCDAALTKAYGRTDYLSDERRLKLEKRLDELLAKYPFLKSHPHLKYIRAVGVAAHHAGHMPHWKLLIEQLMQDGLLAAIFSTSTVAAGVNFPARTVVISQSDRFNGREFSDLTATDLLQMTGRAGRRGMDRIGFALISPGPFQNPGLIHNLFNATPEPVVSQIQINFSMVLNLLLSHRPAQIKNLLDLSLAAFQQGGSRLSREISDTMADIKKALPGSSCGSPEQALILRQKRWRLENEESRLIRLRPNVAWEATLAAALVPGRLVASSTGQIFCVLKPQEKSGRHGIMAAKVRVDLGLKKGRIRQKWLPLSRIDQILETVLDIGPDEKPQDAVNTIRSATNREHLPVAPDQLATNERPLLELDARLSEIRGELEHMVCSDCPVFEDCQGQSKGGISRLMKKLEYLEATADAPGVNLWASFLKHLEFLKSENFVEGQGELTDDGRWASQLRLDHPLLIAAGIREGAWPEENPALLASVVAPFVVDKELTSDALPARIPPELAQYWLRLETAIEPLRMRLQNAGFPTPRLNLRPALAIHAWATTNDWELAVELYGHDPGDMAMLVFRTADNLRQIANLRETHPKLGPTASAAVGLILKEPVIVPL
jgi:superfamily II RNA helicase